MKLSRHTIATISAHRVRVRNPVIMHPHDFFAQELTALLDGAESVEITVGEHPPLFVHTIDDEVSETETRHFIILTQSAVINGAYALNPQIGFLLSQQEGIPVAKPVTYQDDCTETWLAVYDDQSATGEWIPNDPVSRERVYDLTTAAMKDIRARGYLDGKGVRVTR